MSYWVSAFNISRKYLSFLDNNWCSRLIWPEPKSLPCWGVNSSWFGGCSRYEAHCLGHETASERSGRLCERWDGKSHFASGRFFSFLKWNKPAAPRIDLYKNDVAMEFEDGAIESLCFSVSCFRFSQKKYCSSSFQAPGVSPRKLVQSRWRWQTNCWWRSVRTK